MGIESKIYLENEPEFIALKRRVDELEQILKALVKANAPSEPLKPGKYRMSDGVNTVTVDENGGMTRTLLSPRPKPATPKKSKDSGNSFTEIRQDYPGFTLGGADYSNRDEPPPPETRGLRNYPNLDNPA